MGRTANLTLTIATIFVIANCAIAQGPVSDRTPIVVTLLPEATVDDGIVCLDQIARLSGGMPETRRRIAKLDVAELRLFAEGTTVSANQVKFRLLLAGLDASAFKMAGAKQTIVTEIDEPITVRKVLASAEWALRQKYPGDAATVLISPVKGITLPVLDVRASDRVQLEGKLSSPMPRAGKARVDVAIIVNGKTRDVIPVHLDVTFAGAAVDAGSKRFGVLPVGGTVPAPESLEVIVKNRDLVKIIANIGPARIEARGEAMEDGKLGAMIRVRNTESNRVVQGRVEAGGTIVVDY